MGPNVAIGAAIEHEFPTPRPIKNKLIYQRQDIYMNTHTCSLSALRKHYI